MLWCHRLQYHTAFPLSHLALVTSHPKLSEGERGWGGGGSRTGTGKGRNGLLPRPLPWCLPFLIPKGETLVLVLLGSSARKF